MEGRSVMERLAATLERFGGLFGGGTGSPATLQKAMERISTAGAWPTRQAWDWLQAELAAHRAVRAEPCYVGKRELVADRGDVVDQVTLADGQVLYLDCLMFKGEDLRRLPWAARHIRARTLANDAAAAGRKVSVAPGRFIYSIADLAKAWQDLAPLGQGLLLKRAGDTHRAGPSDGWLALLAPQAAATRFTAALERMLKGEGEGTAVQALLFPAVHFDKAQAVAWALAHGFLADKVEVGPGTVTLVQKDAATFSALRAVSLQPVSPEVAGLPVEVAALVGPVVKDQPTSSDVHQPSTDNDIPPVGTSAGPKRRKKPGTMSAHLADGDEDEDGDEDAAVRRGRAEPGPEDSAKGGKTKRVGDQDLSASAFAYVGDPERTETWKLPVHDKAHAQNALARFNQTEGIPSGQRAAVRAKVLRAAHRFSIDTSGFEDAHKSVRKARGGVRFLKAGMTPAKQHVLGVVHEPEEEDAQGDWIPPEDLEAACYDFGKDYAAGGSRLHLEHGKALTSDEAELLENYIAPAEMKVGGDVVKAGSWMQRWHLKDPAMWDAVQKGELTGFSMGGTGWRDEAPVPGGGR